MYVYTAYEVCVTIFSIGDKWFWPVSNFTELHALTLAARSYVFMHYWCYLLYIVCSLPPSLSPSLPPSLPPPSFLSGSRCEASCDGGGGAATETGEEQEGAAAVGKEETRDGERGEDERTRGTIETAFCECVRVWGCGCVSMLGCVRVWGVWVCEHVRVCENVRVWECGLVKVCEGRENEQVSEQIQSW